jgi:hypothetical protein
MKAYVALTGAVFSLLTFAHIWRAIAEGRHLATEPWFVAMTVVAAALSVWAWLLLIRRPKS